MARNGMYDLIDELRGMTEAGTADYTIAGLSYWSDDHLQSALDAHRVDLVRVELIASPTYGAGGTLQYNNYHAGYGNIEITTGGSLIMYIQDGNYNTVGTALYTMDYRRGMATFAANTGGSSYYLTGRSYDLNGAASDIWRRKASHYTASVNFSTDNHRVDMGAIVGNCLNMANFYDGKSGNYGPTPTGVQSVDIRRPDTDWEIK